MALEIERKYLNAPLDDIRARLLALGAQSGGMHFESNMVFDTADMALYHAARLLRLRAQIWPDREKFILTCKSAPIQHDNCNKCKIKEELEVKISDFQIMENILANLGYRPKGRYEKFREAWLVPIPAGTCGRSSQGAIKIFLDLLPFAQVVEKESELESMDCLDHELGLDKLKISTKSYYEIYQEWCQANGLEASPGPVFEEQKKNNLMRKYGIVFPRHAAADQEV